MSKHIGIVGCSAEGAALCYRTICMEAVEILGPHAHPELSMHTYPLADYIRCLEANDLAGVADLMLASAEKLTTIGAQLLICPDNTIHQAFDSVAVRSSVPWLHIAEVVAHTAHQRGYKRVGLTGTRWLVESSVYPEKLTPLGIECIRPPAADIETVNRIILDELVQGIQRPESLTALQQVIQRLANNGCDAIILGCTELPLVLNDHTSPLPTLDSTRLLARAALRIATAGDTNDPTLQPDAALLATTRMRRLQQLPKSLPVGGIITPV
jgi:aspartate racemase